VLERHEHLQVSAEARAQLLAMSASTVERLLRCYRVCGLRGLSATRAGTLLRQHIPIRTSGEGTTLRGNYLKKGKTFILSKYSTSRFYRYDSTGVNML